MTSPKSTLLVALVSGAAFAPTLAAQVYSPAPYAHHRGITSTGYPFGYSSIKKMTYQQIHAGIPSGTLVNSLAWRPNPNATGHGAFTTTLTMSFGDSGPTPDAATTDFMTNLGPNPKVVINNKSINIPAYTPPSAPPADFIYSLPLDSLYIYTSTSGNLCWEVRNHDHTLTTNTTFDLWSYSATALGLAPGGEGCTASGSSAPMELTGTHNGTTLSLTANNAPSTGGSLLLVGLNNTPVDLTGIGAPCALRTDILVMAPGRGSGTTQTWSAPLTVTPANDIGVYLQAAALDPAANAMGAVFSNGLAAVWPYANRPAVRIWTTSGDTATTGSRQLLYGLVIKLSL